MIEKARRASSALKYADEEEDREEFASDVSKLARALDRISRIQTSSLDGNAKRSFKKMDDWAIELEGMAHAFGSRRAGLQPLIPSQGTTPSWMKDPSTDEFDIGGLFADL